MKIYICDQHNGWYTTNENIAKAHERLSGCKVTEIVQEDE